MVQWVSSDRFSLIYEHISVLTILTDLLKRSDSKERFIHQLDIAKNHTDPLARTARVLMWVKVGNKYTWQRKRLSQTSYLHLLYPPSLAYSLFINFTVPLLLFSIIFSLTGDWVWAGVLLFSATSPPLASLRPLRGVNRLILASLSLPLLRNILPSSTHCTGRLLYLQPWGWQPFCECVRKLSERSKQWRLTGK